MSNGWGNTGWGGTGDGWGDPMDDFVQAASFTHGSPSLNGVGVGNTLIGIVVWAGNPGNLPVDSQGNTWKAATQPYAARRVDGQTLNPFLQVFYANNVAGGNTHVGFVSDNGVMATFLLEYTDITTFVASAANAGFSNFSNPILTPNINTKNGDLMLVVALCNGMNLLPTGFTQRLSLASPVVSIADATTIGGLYRGIFSAANVDNYAAFAVTFR
jgi:hypothetical protein